MKYRFLIDVDETVTSLQEIIDSLEDLGGIRGEVKQEVSPGTLRHITTIPEE